MIAFDTCTEIVSVTGPDDTWTAPEQRGGNRHLLAGISALTQGSASGGPGFSDLYFTTGPGSFTGIRIGIATALGFHYGGDVRLHPVDTLMVMAWAIGKEGIINVVLPAHGGLSYYASFEVTGEVTEAITPPRLTGDLPSERIDVPVMPLSRALFMHHREIQAAFPPITPTYISTSDARRP